PRRTSRSYGDEAREEKPRRSFGSRRDDAGGDFEERKPRRTSSRSYGDEAREEKPRRGFGSRRDDAGGDFEERKPRRTSSRSYGDEAREEKPRRGFGSRRDDAGGDFEERKPRRTSSRSYGDEAREEKPRRGFGSRRDDAGGFEERKPRRTSSRSYGDEAREEKPRRGFGSRRDDSDSFEERSPRRTSRSYDDNAWEEKPRRRANSRTGDSPRGSETKRKSKDEVRLNRYIARSGICSRREADELIATGEVKVNGVIVTEMGIKVTSADRVHVSDQLISFERPVYLLLNKPKGYITTTDDPQKRKTVMELVGHACKEHILPVGRLDRNTTGVLLFTNDGDMAKKLTHPSGNIRKVYHVCLDKALTKKDLLDISNGIELDDGFIKPDVITYVGNGEDKKEIGMELHSGRNRIVRRIFEQLGYEVVKLDRVIFANLTKKDVRRGHHRFLTEQEVSWLKML
ncbi:MAG: pseudouridine synthase, partial [Bacteroidales bacterium]|nr:pseudouridine synthase [Bacteroidales bacterium]